MKTIFPALVVALSLVSAGQASMLASNTQSVAADAALYDTFQERDSNFVFVKQPVGWTFVAKDEAHRAHEVFRDESTGFVFVKLATGWKFVTRSN